MEFWKAILGLARQPLVGVPVLLLAVGLAFAGYFAMPMRYVTSVSLVLVSPSGGGSIDATKPLAQTNPLLQFSDDLRTTASILILAMNTTDVFKSVGVTDGGPTELVVDDGRTNPTLLGVGTTGPFVYMQVESDSPVTASKVLSAAEERLRTELEERQNDLKAHPITFVQADEVVRLPPEGDMSIKLQGTVGGALLGVVAGFAAAYAIVRRRLLAPFMQPLLRKPAEDALVSPAAEEADKPDKPEEPGESGEPEDPEEPPVREVVGRKPGINGSAPVPGDLDETGPIDIVRIGDGH
ncbi:hypothetical protein [Nonomuraea jiangxiensis]|uniref:Capsular polysaccharide biosynthesis protein n=1 Tax=Nonomuraea jiangxiensis TaxID=633440 RepID=A0A1G8MF77_9ACTN|nr:hypothetical protein [Nonomuraea jiangxiensis]SDI66522.1 hypothetical protein SAMN05421869_106394 [Nonomuraea jiangxiensis]